MAQVNKNVIFSKQDWHSDDFGLRNPVIHKRLSAMHFLYRRTRHDPMTNLRSEDRNIAGRCESGVAYEPRTTHSQTPRGHVCSQSPAAAAAAAGETNGLHVTLYYM